LIGKYYQRELSNLRTLALEFAKAHPALAPMLAGQSNDPDVERVLEGTAFLSGLIHEKLDGDFPEIVHGLIQLIFPALPAAHPLCHADSFYSQAQPARDGGGQKRHRHRFGAVR